MKSIIFAIRYATLAVCIGITELVCGAGILANGPTTSTDSPFAAPHLTWAGYGLLALGMSTLAYAWQKGRKQMMH
nr:hypothetical protein [Cupriavidus gilardii]